jgi:hypothetical protein
VSHLRVLGSTAYVNIPKKLHWGKLEVMSIKCRLLGWWEHETKGYHLEDIEKQSLITLRDVRFIEDDSLTKLAIIEGKYPPTEDNLMDLLHNHKPQPSSRSNMPAPLSPTISTSNFDPEGRFKPDPTPNVISPPHKSSKYNTLPPRKPSSRVRNAPIRYGVEATPDDVDAAINTKAIYAQVFIAYMGDPPSYQHTLSTPHSKEWEAALKSKYNQLINTGTFEWVWHSPPGDTPLAPSPRVDRSRPKRSDVYRSST